MRKVYTFLLILSTLALSNCGNSPGIKTVNSSSQSPQNGKVEILFKEYEHNFGKIAEGEKVSWIFTFENKGTADLVVNSATTSCGCTVPKYDTKPIPPGGNGILEVIFDSTGRSGVQTKTIAVKSNASVPIVLLKITAEVVTNIN